MSLRALFSLSDNECVRKGQDFLTERSSAFIFVMAPPLFLMEVYKLEAVLILERKI